MIQNLIYQRHERYGSRESSLFPERITNNSKNGEQQAWGLAEGGERNRKTQEHVIHWNWLWTIKTNMYLCILCTPSKRDHEPKEKITTNELNYSSLDRNCQGRTREEEDCGKMGAL